MADPTLKSFSHFALLLGLGVSLSVPAARADVAITARDVNGSAVFSFSGSINLQGMGPGSVQSIVGEIQPTASILVFGSSVSSPTLRSFGFVNSNPPNFGTGPLTRPTSFSGSVFSIRPGTFMVPVDYVSESVFSGSMTFAGRTLLSLGVDRSAGPYTWEIVGDQVVTLSFLNADNSVRKAKLRREIKKFTAKLKKAKRNRQVGQIRAFTRKLKVLKRQLRTLG